MGIENLSEHQICQGFIEASKEINSAFFIQMKFQAAMRRQHEQTAARERLVNERLKEVARMLKILADSRNTPTAQKTPEPTLNALLKQLDETNARRTLSTDSLNIHECIQAFRDCMSRTKRRESHTVFATLEDLSTNVNVNENDSDQEQLIATNQSSAIR